MSAGNDGGYGQPGQYGNYGPPGPYGQGGYPQGQPPQAYGSQPPQGGQYPQGYGSQYPAYGQNTGTSGACVAALVLGLLSLVFFPASVGALICGFIGLGQTRRSGQQGRGMAIAGIVLGVLADAAFIAIIVVVVLAAHRSGG